MINIAAIGKYLTHCGQITPYGDIDLVNIDSSNGLLLDGTKPYLNQCWLFINEALWLFQKKY